MISLQDLDGLKLVHDDNFGTEEKVLDILEGYITQGSQGWGVNQHTMVALHLARDLREALKVAQSATETQNALKGAQMELGRSKAQVQRLKELLDERGIKD